MEIAIATLEERLAVGRVALGGIEFARRAPAGDAIPLDIAQMRTRGGHSLCADADQARLHHRAPRAHAAEPIAAGKKTSHAGPTADPAAVEPTARSEEHTSELQSLMRISYAVFCLTKKHN